LSSTLWKHPRRCGYNLLSGIISAVVIQEHPRSCG